MGAAGFYRAGTVKTSVHHHDVEEAGTFVASAEETHDVEVKSERKPLRPEEEELLCSGDAGGEDGGAGGEEEEGAVPKRIANPRAPTKHEVEQHNLTHVPFRNWCPSCVRGKSTNSHHATKTETLGDELKTIPTIGMDYWYMGEEDRRAQANPMLIVFDEDSEGLAAGAVGIKGVQEWVVRKISKEMEGWGYGGNKATMKSDGEASIVAMKRSVKVYLEIKGRLEESPPGEHQSNGKIEVMIKVLRNQVKTLRNALEARVGEKIPDDHPLLHWVLQWAVTTINRYRVGKDGRTAYERIRGKRNTQAIAEFGEQIHYRRRAPEGERRNKGEPD